MTGNRNPLRRRVLALLWLAAAPMLSLAMETASPGTEFGSPVAVNIGGVMINVPTPVDYQETSRASPELWKTAQDFGGGDSRVLAHFVQSKDLAAYAKGKAVNFTQYLYVQTPKRAEGIMATQAQFDKLRGGLAAMQSDLVRKLEPRLAAELSKAAQGSAVKNGEPIQLRIGEMVSAGVHENRPDFLSYSVLARVSAAQSGDTVDRTMVTTSGLWFVKGKVVILNSYRTFRSPRDLLESRQFIDRWAGAALAAN
jgi:hypothetical protein